MIIAEIGQNWGASIGLAKHMIMMAQGGGADLAKFQLYETDSLYKRDDALYEQVKSMQLTKEQASELFNYGKSIGMEVFFSVFDLERVRWCEEIGVARYKVARRSNKDADLLLAINATGKPVIVSAKEWGEPAMTINHKLLYCITDYPTKPESLHLSDVAFRTLFQGFSDHTVGIDAARVALSMGAEIIEKHFALDHKLGVDAPWSMTPSQLIELKRFEGKVKRIL